VIDDATTTTHSSEHANALRAWTEHAVEIVALAGCVAAGLWSFGGGQRVPGLSAVDLGFHELGHMLAMFLPPVGQALAGSVVQLCVPLGLALYFALVRRENGAAALMLAWAGTAARDVSVYVADAPYQALPLIGGRHDFAYLFGPEVLGDLQASLGVSRAVWLLGLAVLASGAVLAAGSLARWRLGLARARAERERLVTLPRRESRSRVGLATESSSGTIEGGPLRPRGEGTSDGRDDGRGSEGADDISRGRSAER
jgi:hypothetical protein